MSDRRRWRWVGLVALVAAASCDLSFPLAPGVEPRLELEVGIVDGNGTVVELEGELRPGRPDGGPTRAVTDSTLTVGSWVVRPNRQSSTGLVLHHYASVRAFQPGDGGAGPFLNGLAAGPVVPPSVDGFPAFPLPPIPVLRRQGRFEIELAPDGEPVLMADVENPIEEDDSEWVLEVISAGGDGFRLLEMIGDGAPPDSVPVPREVLGSCADAPFLLRLTYRAFQVALDGPGVNVFLRVRTAAEWSLTRGCEPG